MEKIKDIQTLFQNPFLNFYHMDARTDSGREFDYYFVSRNGEDDIKARTGSKKAEGIVIYPIWKKDPDKIVLLRQFRYPVGDYLYELPAGLIDEKETASEAAIREMKEETGLSFEVYDGGEEGFRNAFYMGAGYTDEACKVVFGYADGEFSQKYLEDTETIKAMLVTKEEAKRILREERVSLRLAYLLMNFLSAKKDNPFGFLDV